MPCGCCWCSLPSPAHSSQCSFLHTLVLLGYPQGLLPGAAPLSACPLLCLPPPLPGGTWASGWRVDFSSFCKQVVAVCQAGRRQAGAAPQPGCAKHRGTAWGGDRDTQTQRERDIQTQTDRQTDICRQPRWMWSQKIVLYCPAQPLQRPSPPAPHCLAESIRLQCPAPGLPHPLLLLPNLHPLGLATPL